jgi:radical SAM superfamily enzyme YgiQ (UPF0313 family)
MDILFIWPKGPMPFRTEYDQNSLYFRLFSRYIPFRRPITLSLLTALTPREHNVRVVSGEFKDINFDEKYDLVGITTTTLLANVAYKIADEFRRRGTKVVIGGWHASALPEEAKQHADSVVVGEAEETWPQLLKDYEGGNLKPYYIADRPVDLKMIPFSSNIYPEERGMGIYATRGCPNNCHFCSISNMKYRKIYRMRPISDVIAEIKNSTNKTFAFQDASLTINIDYTKELFRNMIGLNKKFVAMGNINNLGEDDELLKLANKAGCYTWMIGFESISQKSLDSIGKKKNIVKNFPKWIRKIKDYNMAVEGAFIFGFDHDYPDIFKKTDDFIRKNDLKMPFANVLTPYPNTILYNKLNQEGRILTKDWGKYDGHNYVVFQPKHISPEDLLKNVQELEKKWHKGYRSFNRVLRSIRFGLNNFIEVASIEYNWNVKKITSISKEIL